MTNVFGISNCDVVKKTIKWLNENHVAFTFTDFRKEPLSNDKINVWIKRAGLEMLVNKKSTTWKEFSNQMKEDLLMHDKAAEIIRLHPTVLKRPVIETKEKIFCGFKEQELKQLI